MTLAESLLAYQSAQLWSVDMLAAHLDSDKITLSRFLNASRPETIAQHRAEAALIVAATALLANPAPVVRRRMRNHRQDREVRIMHGLRNAAVLNGRGFHDSEICRLIKARQAEISKWRNGTASPTIIAVNRLTDLVDVTADIVPEMWGSKPERPALCEQIAVRMADVRAYLAAVEAARPISIDEAVDVMRRIAASYGLVA